MKFAPQNLMTLRKRNRTTYTDLQSRQNNGFDIFSVIHDAYRKGRCRESLLAGDERSTNRSSATSLRPNSTCS